MIEMHAVFSGRVQGVGFRATVQFYAQKLGLKGTVQNLRDGRVEVFAQSDRATLDAFLNYLNTHSSPAKIEACETKFYPSKKRHKGFSVI